MAYKDITPPAGGKISIHTANSTCPNNPILPFIRGDGTGPDIWGASERVFDAAVQKAYGGKRKMAWFEVFAGETAKNKFDNWLPDDTVEAFQEFPGGHQGAADDAGGRRHPVAERGVAADAGSVCLPAAGAVFQGRAVAGETSGEGGHGHLPRKHGGHLRGHRIRGGHAGSAKGFGLSRQGISQGFQEDPFRHQTGGGGILEGGRRGEFPERRAGGHRHQAGELFRHRAP